MRVALWVVVSGAAAWVYLFIYNSGYGYDALELLVPAQHIADGHPLYSLTTAKPFGPYLVLAGVDASGLGLNHYSVTALIMLQLCIVVGAAYWYYRSFVDQRVAPFAAALVALAGVFMELNFLVVEGVVAAAGLISAAMLGRFVDRGGWWRPVLAGIVVGSAFHFKQTVAFYAIGSCLWLCWYLRPVPRLIYTGLVYSAGIVLTISLPVAVLWPQGLIEPYLIWTYTVPLFEFPSSAEYFDRLYTKLGWFTGLCLCTAVAAMARRDWTTEVLQNRNLTHLFAGGVMAVYPVFKSQAPHYLFPTAAFVLLPITAFWSTALARNGPVVTKRWVAAAIGIVALIAASVIVYRPSAVARLFRVSDWSGESEGGRRLQLLTPADSPILLLTPDNIQLYFHSRRYPNVPVFHQDVQTQSYLDRHPTALLDALADDRLGLVLYDPSDPPSFRFDRMPPGDRRHFWDQFEHALRDLFTQAPEDPVFGSNLWVRKAALR